MMTRTLFAFLIFLNAASNGFCQEMRLMLPTGQIGNRPFAHFSPDGSRIVTYADAYSPCIWDARALRVIGEFDGHTGKVESASFSKDGKMLVTASFDSTAIVWNTLSAKPVFTFKGFKGYVRSAFFSPDDRMVVSTSNDDVTRLWDLKNGLLIKKFEKSGDMASISPDSKLLATTGWDKGAIWDIQTGLLRFRLDIKGRVNQLQFSPNGDMLSAVTQDSLVTVWNTSTGNIIKVLTGHHHEILSACFTADGTGILTGSEDKTAIMWDIKTGKASLTFFGHTSYVNNVCLTNDNQYVITSSWDKTVKVWNRHTAKLLRTLTTPENVAGIVVSPDQKTVLICGDHRWINIWDYHTGATFGALQSHTRPVDKVSYSPGNQKFITILDDDLAQVWDVNTNALLSNLKGHISDIVVSPNRNKYATIQDSKTIIGDVRTGKGLFELKTEKYSLVTKLYFSPDSKILCSSGFDSLVRVWDADSGKLITQLQIPGYDVNSVAFSSDGSKIIITGSKGNFRVFNGNTYKLIKDVVQSKSYVQSAIFSADGTKILTAGGDSCFKIWDAQTMVLNRKIKAHNSELTGAVFSPDDQLIVTSGWDGFLKIWDARSGQLRNTLFAHKGGVMSFSFTEDGKKLMSAGKDNSCKLWDVGKGRLLYTFLSIDTADYIVFDPSGHYDGTPEARKLLYLRCGSEIVEMDQVKNVLWVPKLAEHIMRADLIQAPKLSDLQFCGHEPLISRNPGEEFIYAIIPQKDGLGYVDLLHKDSIIKRYQKSELAYRRGRYYLNIGNVLKKNLLEKSGKITIRATTKSGLINSVRTDSIKIAPVLTAVTEQKNAVKLMLPIGHTRNVIHAEFSKNQKFILTFGVDGLAKLWEASSGILLLDLMETNELVNSATFSPTGNTVLTACDDGLIRIWDTVTGKLLVRLDGHNTRVWNACYSGNGRLIASVDIDNVVDVWDGKTNQLLYNIKLGGKRTLKLKFIQSDNRIIAEKLDGFQIINLKDRTIPSQVMFKEYLHQLKLSENGQTALTMTNQIYKAFDATVTGRFWDTNSGKELAAVPALVSHAYSFALSSDGNKALISCADSSLRIWDVHSGRTLAEIDANSWSIGSVRFIANDKELLTTEYSKNLIRIWDVSTGKLLRQISTENLQPSQTFISSDDSKLLVTGFRENCSVIDLKSAKIVVDLRGHAQGIYMMKIAGDGGSIENITGRMPPIHWQYESGTLIRTFDEIQKGSYFSSLSTDGLLMLTKSEDGHSKIWDTKRKQVLSNLEGETSTYMGKFFSNNSKIVSGDYKGISIWDTKTGKRLFWLKRDGKISVNSVDISPDGEHILASYSDSTIRCWDVKSEKQKYVLKFKGYPYGQKIDFSPDGTEFMLTSINDVIKIYDAASGVFKKEIGLKSDEISVASFSNDGKKIVSGGYDNKAKIWDRTSGRKIGELIGHSSSITSVAFTDNDKYVITASYDHTEKVWDAGRNKFLYTFIAIDSTDYLVTDNFGRFDGSPAAKKLLYFTSGTEVISLDQVKEQLWVPGLAERIMTGDSINAPKLADLHIGGLIPRVEREDKNGYIFRITPQKGGLGETVVSVNGIEISRYQSSQLTRKGESYELKIPQSILQPYLVAGQLNPVNVIAYTTKSGFSSRIAQALGDETHKIAAAPNLYAVMIGISDYKSEDLQLKYAAKDAVDIGRAISGSARKLLNSGNGEHVFLYNLTTDKNRDIFPEKIAIKNVFEKIGRVAKANDILLIFFAGHGLMAGEHRNFYFLTADASRETATKNLSAVAISSAELSEWMRPENIKAQKRVLIFDACNSGKIINDFISIGKNNQHYMAARDDDRSEQIKAIDKLNEKSGLFILAASASNQSAYEFGRYSQGILTYALLKAVKEQPDILENGKYLNVTRWFGAAESTVSNIVRQTGNRQEPQMVSAGNFNIGIVDQEIIQKIYLADEKPVFSACNFQNNDIEILADDQHLNNLLDNKLSELSSRGDNDSFTYYPGNHMPDAYSLTGRYEIKENGIIVKVNLRKKNLSLSKFEVNGTVDHPDELASEIIDKVMVWLAKNKPSKTGSN